MRSGEVAEATTAKAVQTRSAAAVTIALGKEENEHREVAARPFFLKMRNWLLSET